MSEKLSRSLLAGIVALVAADWLTKVWVVRELALGESLAVVDGWLYFIHRQNTGVAFSMFADLPADWRVPLLTAASLVGVALFGRIVLTAGDALTRLAAAVVLAGAVGNLGDRVLNGHVTDFVLFRYFPFVFNFADAAITVGGVLLAIRLVQEENALEPAAEPAPAAEATT